MTGGDQGQVVSAGHFPDQVLAFQHLFAVAKVFRRLVAAASYEGFLSVLIAGYCFT